jgi:hypothetical protein
VINIVSRLYFLLFIIIQPLADCFGALTSSFFSLSQLVRALIFILSIFFIFTSSKTNVSFKITCLFFLLLSITLALFHFAFHGAIEGVVMELTTTLKLLYFPIVTSALYILVNNRDNIFSIGVIEKFLIFYGVLIVLSILIGDITGLGGVINGRGTGIEASKGFLIGANEVGLMLILLFPLLYDWSKGFKKILFMPLLVTSAFTYSALTVFTKSSLATLVVILQKWYSQAKFISQIFYISIFVSFPTYFLMRYWDTVATFLSSSFFNTLMEGDLIGFFFRGRQTYIDAIVNPSIEHSFSYLFPVFGMGEYLMRKISEAPLLLQPGKGSTFEMDFFDLIGFYGMGSIAYFFLILKTLNFIQYSNQNNKYLFSCFLVMVHSALAGHVIFSPQVTVLLASICVISSKTQVNTNE